MSSRLSPKSPIDEVAKLQQHLTLLRDQYSLLQDKYERLQQERDILAASTGGEEDASSFTSRLLSFVMQLHNKDEYSDLEVRVSSSQVIKAHRFVLQARSEHWSTLQQNETLDWCAHGEGVGEVVLQWIYGGQIDAALDTAFMMQLLTAASKLSLPHLLHRCEDVMICRADVRNCVRLYTTADEIGADKLRDHCSTLISTHWDDFTSEDFSHMSGPLLYAMFKEKTSKPLHAAVRHRREDVLFLYLIEYRPQLPSVLESRDSSGSVVLEVALTTQQKSVADTLLQHGACVDATDATGATLLHRAVARGDEFAATYLLNHNASVNMQEKCTGMTPLHVLVDQDTPLQSPQHHNMPLMPPPHPASVSASINRQQQNGYTSPYTTPGGGPHSASAPSEGGSEVMSPTSSVDSAGSFTSRQRLQLCKLLLEKDADPNIQDRQKRSVFHCGVLNTDLSMVEALLQYRPLQLELTDCEGKTALWYALFSADSDVSADRSVASLLVQHGADIDATSGDEGDSLLHFAGKCGAEAVGLFLTKRGAKVSPVNRAGETPLHCSCTTGVPQLTRALLQHGSDPNIQTVATIRTVSSSSAGALLGSTTSSSSPHSRGRSASSRSSNDTSPSTNPFEDTPPQTSPHHLPSESSSPGSIGVFRETPLHRAIANINEADVEAILSHAANGSSSSIPLNLNLRDSNDMTPLGSALNLGLLKVAKSLLDAGADISSVNNDGQTYLHNAVHKRDVEAAAFLLNHGANPDALNREGQTALELCIHGGVTDADLIEQLCKSAASAESSRSSGRGQRSVLASDPPLWQSLVADRQDVAALLVKYGVDMNYWHEGPDNCEQTLLHRAIDENLEDAAVFLLESGCDANSSRKPLNGDSSTDMMTPLHMCAAWGLEKTAAALAQHGAKLNSKDTDGKTALHHAIENGHPGVTEMLLMQPTLDISIRDKSGTTPFAAAMNRRNNAAAKSILDRDPKAAQQFDHKGHNFLHVAVSKGDLESVLFLLSIHVDLSTRTRDDQQLNPLHLATISGNELLVRNLLLAGSEVNALTPSKQTVLHLAALHDHSHLAPILLENNVNFDALDADLNNALHVAVKCGHVAMTKTLLTESTINAVAVNMRGQNPLHLVASHQPQTAPAIAKLFIEAMPDYPLDAPDVHGNTALLLSYQRGGGQLCRVLVSSGANLGVPNSQGETLFNSAVASKALLGSLLDSLSSEPPWAEGDNCMECATKFTIATRKHHCRHCGRLLCSKCSDKLLPILKFGLQKPVRVCLICSQVITLGPGALN